LEIPCGSLNFGVSSPQKHMSKLTALKKQIATLQAQAERIAKEEASSALAKVKQIMAEFNLTIEHLTATVTGKPAAKKATVKATPKVKAASVAKYADPKTGKTWSGFGRAPGWIAGAKNRDAFLVDKSGIKATDPTFKAPAAAKKATVKKTALKVAKAVKAAKKAAMPAGKRMKAEATAAAEAAIKTPATKPAAVKKAATKKVAKPKAAAKKAAGSKASASAAAPAPAQSPATAA